MRNPPRFTNEVGRFDQRLRCASSLKSNTTFVRWASSSDANNFFVASTTFSFVLAVSRLKAFPTRIEPCARRRGEKHTVETTETKRSENLLSTRLVLVPWRNEVKTAKRDTHAVGHRSGKAKAEMHRRSGTGNEVFSRCFTGFYSIAGSRSWAIGL